MTDDNDNRDSLYGPPPIEDALDAQRELDLQRELTMKYIARAAPEPAFAIIIAAHRAANERELRWLYCEQIAMLAFLRWRGIKLPENRN